jgi:hypothetical protein
LKCAVNLISCWKSGHFVWQFSITQNIIAAARKPINMEVPYHRKFVRKYAIKLQLSSSLLWWNYKGLVEAIVVAVSLLLCALNQFDNDADKQTVKYQILMPHNYCHKWCHYLSTEKKNRNLCGNFNRCGA